MTTRKLNVLVYAGNGSTVESVRQCLYSLRRLLSSNYAVIPVTGEQIITEPWTSTCALLVMPGGADLPYCRTLDGAGNRRISQFVRLGGAYIGFCAGGYYGSKRCEFEVGNKKLEVVGNRELAFYPGICRGCAFPGFVYHSEEGARAVELKVNKTLLTAGAAVPESFRCYYNGGGVFVDAPRMKDQGVEILASFTESLNVDPGEGSAAVVYCKVGRGAAILTGPHPEFAAAVLDRQADGPDFPKTIDCLSGDEESRTNFLKACLTKLGLLVCEGQNSVPSLSRIHLSSLDPSGVPSMLSSMSKVITVREQEEYIEDENDTFHIIKPSTWPAVQAIPGQTDGTTDEPDTSTVVDFDAVVKGLVPHCDGYPTSKETPYFNHYAFFSNLKEYQIDSTDEEKAWGKHLMYGEVVTSTNTLLEKNTKLLKLLPTGFTLTATVQVAGRGRSSNVWVSPAGCLMFSTVVRHPTSLIQSAPPIFLQYLAALAVVNGVHGYDYGYESVPVKLKWPNDIYARDPTSLPNEKKYTKIGGILVNSHYNSEEYLSVIGIGVNVTNAAPTISLNSLLPPKLAAFVPERLLASILTAFSHLYNRFIRTGFDSNFERLYYSYWLHTNQIITIESEGGVRARIKGITKDWGLLIAEELGWQDRETGKRFQLQTDSNSFDFFKGLIKRKA